LPAKYNDMPIGVFDSGVGGLTVMKEIITLLPEENIVYLGDTARVPYGIRSPEIVKRYSYESAQFLASKNIKLLVVACNTSSSVSLELLKEIFSIPVVGVIEPGARAVASITKLKRVAVIGTSATVRSGSYERAIKAVDSSIEVSAIACPLFVPLVEEGWLDGEVVSLIAEKYLSALKLFGVDTLVLGCTHYPLIKHVIADVTGVPLIDSAIETAKEVREILSANDMLCNGEKRSFKEFFVTDSPEMFADTGERFLDHEISNISKIELGG
jgi:glutamate racemase